MEIEASTVSRNRLHTICPVLLFAACLFFAGCTEAETPASTGTDGKQPSAATKELIDKLEQTQREKPAGTLERLAPTGNRTRKKEVQQKLEERVRELALSLLDPDEEIGAFQEFILTQDDAYKYFPKKKGILDMLLGLRKDNMFASQRQLRNWFGSEDLRTDDMDLKSLTVTEDGATVLAVEIRVHSATRSGSITCTFGALTPEVGWQFVRFSHRVSKKKSD